MSTDQRPAPMRFFNRFICFVPAILSVVFLVGCAKSIELEKPKPGSSEPKEKEQETIPAPRLSVSTINLDQEGGTATLEVLADTTWKAFCGAADDWNHGVSISPDSGQKGSTTVTITASDKKVELEHFLIVFYNYLPTQGQQSHLYIEKEGTDKKVLEAISQWLAPGGTCETEMFNGRISTLKMYNVNGRAPRILSELDSLKWLEIIDWKGHEGDFVFLKDFSILERLYMTLYGVNKIPKELLTLTQLKRLYFVSNDTPLQGSMPEEFRYFPDLEYLGISPGLSGPIPKWVLSSKFWPKSQHYLMTLNDFDPLFPSFTITDYRSGKEYNLADEITSHKYTMLVTYDHRTDEGEIDGGYGFSRALAPYIEQMYQAYKDEGLQVIGFPEMMVNVNYGPFALASYPTTVYLEPDGTDGPALLEGFGKEYNDYNPDMTILDSNGNICVSTNVMTGLSAAADFLKEKFGHGFLYESTDYSRDGEVRLVQKAAKGKGIDLVFIGNCFSDRKIADGTFDKVMNAAVNAFFYEDPMYSMRDLFNVYIITTVSPNEYYGPGTKSAIDLSFPGGSCYSPSASISANLQQVYDYASDVASNDGRFVVVNYMPMRKGSCAMSFKDGGKYSEGGFTAFCAARYGVEMIEILTHEACGHGIGKFADEYVSEVAPWGALDEATLKDFQERGYDTNYSRTSDPEKVPWARFLKDSRYNSEQVGVYPVGNDSGYRSSKYDVMGVGGMMNEHFPFSAPNRYTLWRAISYLAYGDGFEDDFEEFVEMDAEVRKFRSDWIAGLNSRWYHAFDPKPDSWFETLTFDLVP